MTIDRRHDIKTRMRADLLAAMKDKRSAEVRTIRALIAAIDNAEAPPISADNNSTEVERLLLSDADVRDVLMNELNERETAASELERLGETERAGAVRTEALVTRRYLA